MARRMAYSKLTRFLRDLYATHAEAEARKMPMEEVAGERAERREQFVALRAEKRAEAEYATHITRRDFLFKAGEAAAAGVMFSAPSNVFASTARIVVVGAGLAGLRFAHALWHDRPQPMRCTIYEANSRLGGRTWTNRGFFNAGGGDPDSR